MILLTFKEIYLDKQYLFVLLKLVKYKLIT